MKYQPFVFLVLLMVTFASAEIQIPNDVGFTGGVSEPGMQAAGLTFLSPSLDVTVRYTYRAATANRFQELSAIGTQCAVGEYIRPARCADYNGGSYTNCKLIFSQDWLKDDINDNLPIKNWADYETWNANNPGQNMWYLADENNYPWDIYQCLVKNVAQAPVTTPPTTPTTAQGYFSGPITYSPVAPVTNDYITVKGSYYAKTSASFILEAYVDVSTQQPLAVSVVSSSSACDGSAYWSGKIIQGVAGERYDFAFTVKTPANEGKYTVKVYATTGCYKDGGEVFADSSIVVPIKANSACSTLKAISVWGETLYGSRRSWETTSAGAITSFATYSCTTEEITKYCGTTDTDKDSIPDGCDYCPQDKGVPQTNNGCHPCFALGTSAAAKECYKTNYQTYGIPSRIVDVINPVVKTETSCSANVLITKTIREFGDLASSTNTPCATGEVCKVISTSPQKAACSPIAVTPIKSWKGCTASGTQATVTTYYSDGSSKITSTTDCKTGTSCVDGACVVTDSCGGNPCGDTPTSGGTDTPECTKDSECDSGYFCQSSTCQKGSDYCLSVSDCDDNQFCEDNKCKDMPVPECTSTSECNDGYECVQSTCVVVNPDAEECTTDEDCIEGDQCLDDKCRKTAPWEPGAEEPCTEDTVVSCDTGTIVTAICKDGQLVPTDVTCVGASPKGIVDIVEQAGTGPTITYIVLIVLAVGLGAYYFSTKKGKKRRRK